jgi:glutamyl-tRNA synthetase/glutamyl-Q tRNA(Asp) synthetase
VGSSGAGAPQPIALDLAALAARLPSRPLTRFAPSPTGYLHLGHIVNALWVWGAARALGGRVLLRIEDHDATRCRPEYERALLQDLEWLGLVPDEVAPRQSESGDAYAAAVSSLSSAHHLYGCECSRRTIASEADDVFGAETRYPGRCRHLGLMPGEGRGTRLVLGEGVEEFSDALLGPRRQEPDRQCGDLLLRDRLGQWTYQFAVTVDDLRQGVDLVIRGEDLLESTGRQIRLGRMLGRGEPAVFLHHPLIVKPDGAKLSKAAGDTGVRELRNAGLAPEEVWLEAGRRGGVPSEVLAWARAARS